MDLKERLQQDMKVAMKAGAAGRERLGTIRLVLAALQNAEIEKRRALSPDEMLAVLTREAKQRRDALAEFKESASADYVDKLQRELAVLEEYLPEQLSEDEVRRICAEVVAETGASSMKDMGRVMGPLMQRLQGQADGRLVNQIVREMLQSPG